MKTRGFISSFVGLSAFFLGYAEQSLAIGLTLANTLYTFGTQTYGNGAGECKKNSIICTGSFLSSTTFTGVAFNPFSVSAMLGNQGIGYGFEQGTKDLILLWG